MQGGVGVSVPFSVRSRTHLVAKNIETQSGSIVFD
jgi:hypothetical protein